MTTVSRMPSRRYGVTSGAGKGRPWQSLDLLDDPSVSTRIVATSERNFFACASLGSLQPGHLLVCPVFPGVFSIAAALLHADVAKEFDHFVQRTSKQLSEKYNKPIFAFEHGCTSAIERCGTFHAHLHLIPLSEDIQNSVIDGIRGIAGNGVLNCSLLDAREMLRACTHYLWCGNDQHCYFFPVSNPSGIASQLFRMLIAKELGQEDQWDWRRYPREDVVAKTMSDLGTVSQTSLAAQIVFRSLRRSRLL